jgi:ATP-binding cassette, subfamily B, multidrug efflux pump
MQAAMKKDNPGSANAWQEKKKPAPGPSALRRSMGYLWLHRRSAGLAYGTLIVATLAQLAIPKLVQNMINTIVDGFQAQSMMDNPLARIITGKNPDELRTIYEASAGLLVNAAIIIVAFAVVRGLFAFVQTYMAEWASQGIAFDMRNQIFSKIQRLSFSYYDRNQTGQLMIRATDDVEKVRLFIAQGTILTFQAILLLVVTLIILFATNWRLTLVVIPILPLTMILFMIFGKVTQPLFGEYQKRVSALNTVLQENVSGIKVVKAFVRQREEQTRFDKTTTDFMQQALKIGATMSFLFPLIFTIMQLGQVAILYFAAPQILGGSLTLGEYQEFTLYLLYLFFPLGQLGFIITLMAQASASADRIFEILDAKSDVTNKPDAIELPAIQGLVEFKDVTFSYFGSGTPVLNKVSFEAKPGQTIALLGSTGSGKTSIINMIPRFYDVTDGAVLIDGYDIRDVTLDSLRSQIGIVLQETNLFSGTIRDNIAFGRSDASDEEVMEAAKAASAHNFIMAFPEGYNTSVGERGSTLSGGQKQRIAIARALLLKPRILILDDSTSAVDFETERLIQAALDKLMEGRTSFVIAQRISTARNADLIVVLDKGEIKEIGTHAELIENSPIYAEIYSSQLVDDAAAQPQGAD